MNPIEFEGQTVVFAKNQPEYRPLPAHVDPTSSGTVTFCWRLTIKERLKLLFSGVLWHQVLSFHQPLQPQLLSIEKPELYGVGAKRRPGSKVYE